MRRIDSVYIAKDDYKQPGSYEVMQFVDRLQRASEDTDTPIGFITSSTYLPSRLLDSIRFARAGTGRNAAIVSYGMQALATVKKDPAPQPPVLGQLAGEAHKTAKVYQQLIAQ